MIRERCGNVTRRFPSCALLCTNPLRHGEAAAEVDAGDAVDERRGVGELRQVVTHRLQNGVNHVLLLQGI